MAKALAFPPKTHRTPTPNPSPLERGKAAFTLAEVLITLGIIGIVAAMTMPTLIQNHRRGVVETALAKFYTTMNQAINLSVVENGETKYWGFAANNAESIEQFYNKYLKNYTKILKTDVTNVKMHKNGTTRSLFSIYFTDGSGVSLDYRGHDWYYCVNAKNLPNFSDKRGTNCFMFGFYPVVTPNPTIGQTYSNKNFNGKGVEPFVINVTEDENGEQIKDDDGNKIMTTEKDLYQQKCYAKAIQLNGWKIPDDYPLKF